MPEWPSAPVMVTGSGAVCQPPGAAVVSLGVTVSTRIVWSRGTDVLPAKSSAQVFSVCVPSATIGTLVPIGPDWASPPSSCHQTCLTPESESTASTTTLVGALCHPGPPGSVMSTGLVRSTRTVSARHADTLPSLSTARVLSVQTPDEAIVTSGGEPASVIAPLSMQYCIVARPDSLSL